MVTILLSCLQDKLTQPIIELLVVSNVEVNGPLIVVTKVGLLSMLAPLLPDIDRPCSTFGCVLRNRAEFGSIQLTVARKRGQGSLLSGRSPSAGRGSGMVDKPEVSSLNNKEVFIELREKQV